MDFYPYRIPLVPQSQRSTTVPCSSTFPISQLLRVPAVCKIPPHASPSSRYNPETRSRNADPKKGSPAYAGFKASTHRLRPERPAAAAEERTETASEVLRPSEPQNCSRGQQPLNAGADSPDTASIEDAWWQQYSYNDNGMLAGTYNQSSISSYESEEVDMEEGGASSSNGTERSATQQVANKATYEVLKMDASGNYRLVHVRRRDLLREHRIQPRDLRRIDPSVDFNKTSPSITIKENVLLICIGGVRAIATAYKALLFEPNAPATRKFFDIVAPHLKSRAEGNAGREREREGGSSKQSMPMASLRSSAADLSVSHSAYMARFYSPQDPDQMRTPPFEMEVLEGALLVATGQLDAEMESVEERVQALLANLPRDINPVNLEELRKVKSALVELETKADTVRKILEEVMDDDDELRELNLSNRPRREERRRQRERKKLERELERAQELKEEIEEQLEGAEGDESRSSRSRHSSGSRASISGINGYSQLPGTKNGSRPGGRDGSSNSRRPLSSSPWPQNAKQRQDRLAELRSKFDRERLAELRSKFGLEKKDRGSKDEASGKEDERGDREERRREDLDQDWISRLEGSEEDIQEAQEALEEMVEQEEEEQEIEEIEDLLEYYHQRAGGTQSEAEQLLEGARDLEESIGVSLSARRYEVNRLELTLSIGSFAAAIGAVVAGIFGMNMRSKLEESVTSFWGATGCIILGCAYLFFAIMAYTRKKNIL